MAKKKEKPTFALLRGDNITGKTLAKLHEQLTGETSTKEQIAKMQATLDAAKKK